MDLNESLVHVDHKSLVDMKAVVSEKLLTHWPSLSDLGWPENSNLWCAK
jgi:hypothetical protein